MVQKDIYFKQITLAPKTVMFTYTWEKRTITVHSFVLLDDLQRFQSGSLSTWLRLAAAKRAPCSSCASEKCVRT